MICRGCLRPNEQFIINNSMVKETGGPGECERCKEDFGTLYAYEKMPGAEATIEDSVEEEEEEAGEEEEVVEVEPVPEASAEEESESILKMPSQEEIEAIDPYEVIKIDGDTDDTGRTGDEVRVPVPEVRESPTEGQDEPVLPEVQEESIEGEEEAEAPKAKKRTKAELEAYIAELEAKVQK